MTTLELELYQSVPSVEFNTYWIPCTWFINLLKEARNNRRLPDAQGLKIIMEVCIYRIYLCLFYLYETSLKSNTRMYFLNFYYVCYNIYLIVYLFYKRIEMIRFYRLFYCYGRNIRKLFRSSLTTIFIFCD